MSAPSTKGDRNLHFIPYRLPILQNKLSSSNRVRPGVQRGWKYLAGVEMWQDKCDTTGTRCKQNKTICKQIDWWPWFVFYFYYYKSPHKSLSVSAEANLRWHCKSVHRWLAAVTQKGVICSLTVGLAIYTTAQCLVFLRTERESSPSTTSSRRVSNISHLVHGWQWWLFN